jgi:hypothetical protein
MSSRSEGTCPGLKGDALDSPQWLGAEPAKGPPDPLSRLCLLVIAASLLTLAVGSVSGPRRADAQRDTVNVNLDRIGGRYLGGDGLPVRCVNLPRP